MTTKKRGLASNPLFTKTDEPDAPGLSAKPQVRPMSPRQPEVQAAYGKMNP